MTIENEYYDVLKSAVLFNYVVEGKKHICNISLEALEDKFNASTDNALEVFKNNKETIEKYLSYLKSSKGLPEDSTIFIETNNF